MLRYVNCTPYSTGQPQTNFLRFFSSRSPPHLPSDEAAPDDEGPEVRVFINDTNFISGGITDANPINISLISDSSGINTVGSGIGHDILGILDGETNAPFILNEYFQSDLNSYQSGTVTFPFFNLAPGEHHLLVRVWDVNNNMGEGETYFIVDD